MKIDTIKSGGQSQGGLDNSGGTLTGPLLLCRNPELPMEAATKQYVDQSLQNLSASNFTTGTLPIARLPAMGGDVSSEAGTNNISLTETGIVPGEYARIGVDAKGRVIGTGILSATDLPNISFNKVISDKPTTLEGYGIGDAVLSSGSIMTGPLILASNPNNGDNLVTKQYIDSMTNSLASAKTGDVVRKAYPTTPPGFLKCNGAEVSKTTYADLYAIIGESNNTYSLIGGGKPWVNQYSFNNSQSQDIGPWTSSGTIPGSLTHSTTIVTKNRVYTLGGYNGSSAVSTVWTAPINLDGTLGSWTTGTSLPTAVMYCQAVVAKGKAYLIGGSNGSSPVNTVYSAIINADGTLGSWSLISTLPANISYPQVVVTNSYIYLCGGTISSAASGNVYRVPLKNDGSLGTWETDTSMPGPLAYSNTILTKNRVYIVSGTNGPGATTTVYTAPINADGTIGTWSTGTPIPSPAYYGSTFVTKNRAYILSGWNGTNYVTAVYTAPINPDGTLGTWTTGTNLVSIAYSCNIFATKSRLYIAGGYTGSAYISSMQYASISDGLNDYSAYYSDVSLSYLVAGSGKPWHQQYDINSTQTGNITGWTADALFPEVNYLHQCAVTKNRVYSFGGDTSQGMLSTVYTAPLNANGSIGTWTTTTPMPAAISRSQVIVTKNRIHVLGGYQGGSSSNLTYSAPINADGTLGSWTSGNNLPATLCVSQAIYTKNRVYLLGGNSDGSVTSTSAVFTATVAADGTIGTWSAAPSLPVALGWSQAAVTKNRVYLIGGWTTGAIATVYTATINSDGLLGQWTTSGSLPGAIHWSSVFVSKNKIYMFGGHNGSGAVAAVYQADILPDGTLGTWVTGASLPSAMYGFSMVATKNRIYIIAGNTNGSVLRTVYYASISEGLNDYSPYYDGTITPLVPVDATTLFKLPDMSATDVNGIYHYIKF